MLTRALTREELLSLRELMRGGLQRIIPFAHERRLVGLELATKSLSGLRLTPAGERLAGDPGPKAPTAKPG